MKSYVIFIGLLFICCLGRAQAMTIGKEDELQMPIEDLKLNDRVIVKLLWRFVNSHFPKQTSQSSLTKASQYTDQPSKMKKSISLHPFGSLDFWVAGKRESSALTNLPLPLSIQAGKNIGRRTLPQSLRWDLKRRTFH